MSMPKVDLDVFKYMIDDIVLVSPAWTKPYTIKAEKITSIAVMNNYDGAMHPQIALDCVVDRETYYEILAQSENIEASFAIAKANLGKQSMLNQQSVSGKPSTDTVSYTEEYVNCTLKIFDQGYLHSKDVVDNQLDQIRENNQAVQTDYQIKLFLLDAKNIKNYRKNKSFIINGNMNDTLFEIITSRGFENIIMTSAPDVESSEYCIPYGDLGQNLTDLNQNYGIYEYKYLFFIGLDRVYMISKGDLGKDTEYGELGNVNLYIEPYDMENASINAGSFIDEANKIYILGTTDAKIDNVDSLADYAGGGKITSAVAGTKNSYTDKVGTEEIEFSRLIGNRKLHSQFIHEVKEAKRMLKATFKNVDIGIITPNKLFKVMANEQYFDNEYEVSGDYRLSSSEILFLNDGNGSFAASVSLTLFKIN